MGLVIHHERIREETAAELVGLCPFGAIEYDSHTLSINSGCKSCKLCVRKGPAGCITWEEEEKPKTVLDKSQWRGIVVYADKRDGGIHPVTLELLGKARELAAVIRHPVYALLIGSRTQDMAEELLHYGADRVYVYDDPAFADYRISPYTEAFTDFIRQVRPSSILVGATNLGRSLAPRVAARCSTGLTADCTVLKMKENTDLVQIRPAFGGNIMAQIVTPNTRPQFCTVRYKIFSAPERSDMPQGQIVPMAVTDAMRRSGCAVLSTQEKPHEVDISEAEVIVAVGRAYKKESDLAPARELAALLGAQLAGTRPMIEAGWLGPKQQIGLSGRTVKPKLLIALGISGSVQFVAGMKNSDYIIAVNQNPDAGIFNTAHLGLVGDVHEIVPLLIRAVKEGGLYV